MLKLSSVIKMTTVTVTVTVMGTITVRKLGMGHGEGGNSTPSGFMRAQVIIDIGALELLGNWSMALFCFCFCSPIGSARIRMKVCLDRRQSCSGGGLE